jgi:ADP-ribose pyrophosphatase YjhB (NUDIX family)
MVHRYNGFGGKVEPGESVEAAALRELEVAVARLLFLFTIAARGKYFSHLVILLELV